MTEQNTRTQTSTNNGNSIPNGHLQNNDHHHKSSELNFLRNRLQHFQTAIIKDFEKRLEEEIEAVMQEIRKHELQLHEFKSFAKTANNAHHSTWSNRIATETSNTNTDATTKETVTDNKMSTMSTMSTATATVASTTAASEVKHIVDKEQSTQQQHKRRRALPDKVFVVRESYLTALLEVDHMRTIYHIFHIILLVMFMNSICYDYFVEGRINFGLGTFRSGFDKIHYVLGIWLLEHVFILTLYYAFKVWAFVRAKLARQAPLQRFWSHSCLITYISSQLVFGYVASALCLKFDMPFVTASVLLLETSRLLMKMHAFVRTNAGRIAAGKLKSDMDASDADIDIRKSVYVPPISCYIYFLFAPTLIYRDNYPRTTHIRWKFAFARLMEVVAIAFLYSYIHERHIKVHFYEYGREALTESSLIVKMFGMIMPSIIIFLCGFYMILHSWLNFTAELLRFGDRMFYKDWWTSSSYDAYYRNWNVVVHDWLYEYVYKDCYNHVFKGSKVAASLMVFNLSALVHEQVLGFALQLFFPIMFLFFGGIGVMLVFATRNAPKRLGNIMVWATLIIGNSMMISLYCMEYYARLNCPRTYENWTENLVPAIWTCYRS